MKKRGKANQTQDSKAPADGHPMGRHVDAIPELEMIGSMLEHLFSVEGATTPQERRTVEERAACLNGADRSMNSSELSPVVANYVDKVAVEAYKVVDRDIDAMRDEGLSEDYIHEVTLAATTGASLARLERGLAILEEVEGGNNQS